MHRGPLAGIGSDEKVDNFYLHHLDTPNHINHLSNCANRGSGLAGEKLGRDAQEATVRDSKRPVDCNIQIRGRQRLFTHLHYHGMRKVV